MELRPKETSVYSLTNTALREYHYCRLTDPQESEDSALRRLSPFIPVILMMREAFKQLPALHQTTIFKGVHADLSASEEYR